MTRRDVNIPHEAETRAVIQEEIEASGGNVGGESSDIWSALLLGMTSNLEAYPDNLDSYTSIFKDDGFFVQYTNGGLALGQGIGWITKEDGYPQLVIQKVPGENPLEFVPGEASDFRLDMIVVRSTGDSPTDWELLVVTGNPGPEGEIDPPDSIYPAISRVDVPPNSESWADVDFVDQRFVSSWGSWQGGLVLNSAEFYANIDVVGSHNHLGLSNGNYDNILMASSENSSDDDSVGIFGKSLTRSLSPTVDFSDETPAVQDIAAALAAFGIIIDANA